MSGPRRILVTGSSGLIGSEVASHFDREGWEVHGVDNNQRAVFSAPPATPAGTSSGWRPTWSGSSTMSSTSATATACSPWSPN